MAVRIALSQHKGPFLRNKPIGRFALNIPDLAIIRLIAEPASM
jgi:hypothetical protein